MSWARNRSRYGFSVSQGLELGDERKLTAERKLGVDPHLDRRQSQLLEALHLNTCERLELEVGERPPLPQPLRRPERLRRFGSVAGRERLVTVCDELLEPLEVELAGIDAQEVAGSARDESRLVVARGASTLRRRDT